jgi:hypothetical protein
VSRVDRYSESLFARARFFQKALMMNYNIEKLIRELGLSPSEVTRQAERAGVTVEVWLGRLQNTLTGRGVYGTVRNALLRKLASLVPGVRLVNNIRSTLMRFIPRGDNRPLSESDVPASVWQAVERMTKSAPLSADDRSVINRHVSTRALPYHAPHPHSLPPGPTAPKVDDASKFNSGFEPPRDGETSPLTEEVLCVEQSSNVYSFAYDYESSTLFVTYQGHKLRPKSLKRQRKKIAKSESSPQLVGEIGSTVGSGRGGRGALYAYLDVPSRVFERMKLGASKGKFVWNELRIRGTIYGHKFPYHLVQGFVSTQRGVGGTYIPRRATKEGFRTRSVAELGTGRRGFQTSTLPQQDGTGFRTRQAGDLKLGPKGPKARK